MANYATNEFRGGLKLLIDGEPCSIIENEMIKPGKGQAFNRVKLRNLKTGRVIERTFKSGESAPGADVVEKELQFLYYDGNHWHFMDPASFEQFEVNEATIGESKQWLKEQDSCVVVLYNGAPLTVEPPNFVELKVTETDPGLRGDTSGGGSKPATLETGAVIRVPLFINEGDVLRIDTRTGDYVSRAGK